MSQEELQQVEDLMTYELLTQEEAELIVLTFSS